MCAHVELEGMYLLQSRCKRSADAADAGPGARLRSRRRSVGRSVGAGRGGRRVCV